MSMVQSTRYFICETGSVPYTGGHPGNQGKAWYNVTIDSDDQITTHAKAKEGKGVWKESLIIIQLSCLLQSTHHITARSIVVIDRYSTRCPPTTI